MGGLSFPGPLWVPQKLSLIPPVFSLLWAGAAGSSVGSHIQAAAACRKWLKPVSGQLPVSRRVQDWESQAGHLGWGWGGKGGRGSGRWSYYKFNLAVVQLQDFLKRSSFCLGVCTYSVRVMSVLLKGSVGPA